MHSNFTWTGSSPSNHSWRQKTRGTGLPDSEDRIPLCSLVLTQYRSVTNGRTDGFDVAYTALAALRRAVKKLSHSVDRSLSNMRSYTEFVGIKTVISKPVQQTDYNSCMTKFAAMNFQSNTPNAKSSYIYIQ